MSLSLYLLLYNVTARVVLEDFESQMPPDICKVDDEKGQDSHSVLEM